MATVTRHLLSGSTNGLPIPVAATATPGTLIHTAHTTAQDEVYLTIANVTNATATLTVEWGGVTDPGSHLVKAMSIPPNSPAMPISLGQALSGGLVVRAFSGTASALNITGYVIRYTA